MRCRRGTRLPLTLCLCLLGIASGTHVYAQAGAGEPSSTLVLTQGAYFQTLATWVENVGANSLDPDVSTILSAGRDAAERGDWEGAEAAVDHLADRTVPPGLIPMLRAMVAAGRGDAHAQYAFLAEAAQDFAATGSPDLAVLTWRYLAQAADAAGQPAEAQAYAERALVAAPDAPAVHFLLARLAWNRGDPQAALQAWERTVALAPTDPVAWRALARGRQQANQPAGAVAAAAEAIRLAPGWPAPRLDVAAWLLAANRGEDAFNILLPVSGQVRTVPEIARLLREATDQMGGTAAFRQEAAALKESGGTAEGWASLAYRYSKAEAFEEAATAYRAALAADPTNGEYGFLLGGVLAKMWDVDGAISAYRQAMANGFSPVGGHFNVGLMQSAAERYDESIASFNACIAAGGSRPYVLARRGEAEFRAGHWEQAAETLSACLDAEPDLADTWGTYGRTLLALELPEAARTAFLRALELQPNLAKTRYWLGRAEMALDRPGVALEWYQEEYGVSGFSAELAYASGLAGQAAGRPSIADQSYRLALLLAPGLGDAWRGLADMERARGQLDAANRGYERAHALGLDTGLLHLRWGETLWALGHAADAQAAFERAVARDPDLTTAWRRLGAVQAERGETRAARQSFARAYDRTRTAWFMQRSLGRMFLGLLWLGGFLIVLIVGTRFRRSPDYAWLPLFVGRVDLAILSTLALIGPIAALIAGQRLVYASFQLQQLTNSQALGVSVLVALRDGLFLGVIPLAYVWWRYGRPRWGPLPPRRVLRDAVLGGLGFLVFLAPGALWRALEGDATGAVLFPRGRDLMNASTQSLIASVIGIGLVSSVAQEVFYRGILYRLTRNQVGAVLAAALTAVLFAAFHFQPPNFWWYAFFGMLAAGLYQRTGALTAPIVMHVIYNVLQVVM